MSNVVVQDLEDAVSKITDLVSGLKNAEPSLAEKLFAAVEQVFLDAGYVAPTTPEAPPAE